MRRKKTESIRDVVQVFLKQNRLEKPLYEKKIIDAWPQVLGKTILDYTQEMRVHNKKLYVTLSSSVLRHDLFISRDKIMESLNNHVGHHVINEIVFK